MPFCAPAKVLCVCVSVCAVSVSHLYGFGLLDAEGMVKEAERWKQVPSQHECVEEAPIQPSRYPASCTAGDLRFESGLPLNPPLLSHLCLFLSPSSHGLLSHFIPTHFNGGHFLLSTFLLCFLFFHLLSLPSDAHRFFLSLSLRLMTELFILARR